MRDANRRFLRGFEDAAIGMAILTRELRLVRVNDTMCELLARPSEDLLGHSILEFTHPNDVKRSLRKADSMTRGDPAPLVKRYVRPDGSVVEASLTWSRRRSSRWPRRPG